MNNNELKHFAYMQLRNGVDYQSFGNLLRNAHYTEYEILAAIDGAEALISKERDFDYASRLAKNELPPSYEEYMQANSSLHDYLMEKKASFSKRFVKFGSRACHTVLSAVEKYNATTESLFISSICGTAILIHLNGCLSTVIFPEEQFVIDPMLVFNGMQYCIAAGMIFGALGYIGYKAYRDSQNGKIADSLNTLVAEAFCATAVFAASMIAGEIDAGLIMPTMLILSVLAIGLEAPKACVKAIGKFTDSLDREDNQLKQNRYNQFYFNQ